VSSDVTNKIEDAAAQILQGAIDSATKGAEFLKEQIPDLLKQLLAWNLAADFMVMALAAVVAFVSWKAVTKWVDQELDCGMWAFPKVLASIIGGIASGDLTIGAIISMFDALKIIIAPKVWLLEYASSLIRHH
jgi:hypothetical protein